ncbi:MAG: 39S ribosomal protein L24, mitochondrial [Alyxoria varia]|nr:MAG: 39S ribosomal protein L24, mitochondrial [Alyxoria varia]
MPSSTRVLMSAKVSATATATRTARPSPRTQRKPIGSIKFTKRQLLAGEALARCPPVHAEANVTKTANRKARKPQNPQKQQQQHPRDAEPKTNALTTSNAPRTLNHAPPYPPTTLSPTNRTYTQKHSGLYGASTIQFGNNVTGKFDCRTRRVFRPNILHKSLYSESLQKFVKCKVSARVLRTIDKVGGIDEYVCGRSSARVNELGHWGWGFRWLVMQRRGMVPAGAVRPPLLEEREERERLEREGLEEGVREKEDLRRIVEQRRQDPDEARLPQDLEEEEEAAEQDVHKVPDDHRKPRLVQKNM